MSRDLPATGLQLRSLITSDGRLRLSLVDEPVPTPGPDEVLVRVDAAPINPSDLGLLLGPADVGSIAAAGNPGRPVVTASVPAAALPGLAARLDQSMPVGNEGAGEVVAAGVSAAAQALLGRKVAALGGAMYAQYRCLPIGQCLALPADASPEEGASAFVNPLTALGMVETMRREGHRALVHTAAASNLGQMLVRICQADGIDLVNIVRKPDQVALLRGLGARHVLDSSAPDFMDALIDALAETGATIAFDATGGGTLGGQILSAMERAINRSAKEYSRYGSATHKQVYLYGSLDTSPTHFVRDFGVAWSMGGWLLMPFMAKIGAQGVQQLKQRVHDELKTTFASHYAGRLSLTQALEPASIAQYARRATGEKFLIVPSAA